MSRADLPDGSTEFKVLSSSDIFMSTVSVESIELLVWITISSNKGDLSDTLGLLLLGIILGIVSELFKIILLLLGMPIDSLLPANTVSTTSEISVALNSIL